MGVGGSSSSGLSLVTIEGVVLVTIEGVVLLSIEGVASIGGVASIEGVAPWDYGQVLLSRDSLLAQQIAPAMPRPAKHCKDAITALIRWPDRRSLLSGSRMPWCPSVPNRPWRPMCPMAPRR
jgi:hypothetical protein